MSLLCSCCFFARGRRSDTEMWALQAWGELALGLAAPRAAHAAGNDYGNQALAWDVVGTPADITCNNSCGP